MRIDHSVPTRLVRRARLAVVSAVGASLLCGSAGAENAPPSRAPLGDTVIVYEAPEGCPSRTEFEARVRSRMPARETTATSLRRIEARLSRNRTRVAASVVLTDASGAVTTRRIAAASCDEAVDGLALIVALTVDPAEAHGGSASPPQTTEAEGPPTSSSSGATRGEHEGPAQGEPDEAARPQHPASVQNETAHAPAVSASETSEPVAPSSSQRLRFGASASFLVASGTVPRVSPGGELAFAVSTWTAPAFGLRVGGRLVASGRDTGDEGSASFSWWSAFLGGCVGTDAAAVVVLTGCAVYELGQLGATGSQTRNAASSMEMWQALGPELRFEWGFAAPVALDAAMAGMFPLRSERFFIARDIVYRVPALGIRAEIGAAIRF